MKLFSTSCETLYLDWRAPLLPSAVDRLLERYAKDKSWDLANLLCVLPTQRSADRLSSLLRRAGESGSFNLTMPDVMTIGELPERLYIPPRPLALEFEQTLAWVRALRASDRDALRSLISVLPSAEPVGPWIELAGTLRNLHSELASCERQFADVVELAETPSERRRWRFLTHLHQCYLEQLDAAGLCDPHWARQDAMLRGKFSTDSTLVLIGVSDISELMVSILRSLNADMISMVAAPETASNRFDEFGCVATKAWLEHELPLDDRQLITATDVSDQAVAVAEVLADFARAHSADEVTVGVTDASQVGPIEIELRGCGVSTHRQIGWPASESAWGKLLQLTTTHLQRSTWQSLAALVRHSTFRSLISDQLKDELSSPDEWLVQLDRYLAEHFPVRVDDPMVASATKTYPLVPRMVAIVKEQLDELISDDAQLFSVSCNQIGKWLDKLISVANETHEPLSPRTMVSQTAIRELLDRLGRVHQSLDLTMPAIPALEALLSRLQDLRIVEPAAPDDVEILGWLDLALDDAPALVVNGLNHPFVPAAVTSDAFLPGGLRSQLRVADNERRYARDVYAMHLMLQSRSSVRFIVGQSAADGNPTPPSRLVAAAKPTDSARRIRNLLLGRRESVQVEHRWDSSEPASVPIPELPRIDVSKAIPYISVTGFKDYLTCPYRFYLRHVLKMRPLDDARNELAANQFGDLVHGAVEYFGESEYKDADDAKEIEKRLVEFLHQYADERFGQRVSTAVHLQIVQAKRRLKGVAKRQAERVVDGWTIHATELAAKPDEHGAGIDVDGQWMGLSGRFDRVDYHAKDDRWAILDYKTHGHKPEKKHLRRTDDGFVWIDLQLPLYRLMVPFLGIDADPAQVQLGYFNVSEKESETRVNIADFTESQMRDAVEVIHACVRSIRLQEFEPTQDRVLFDDYDMILQTGVANRLLDNEDVMAGQEADA